MEPLIFVGCLVVGIFFCAVMESKATAKQKKKELHSIVCGTLTKAAIYTCLDVWYYGTKATAWFERGDDKILFVDYISVGGYYYHVDKGEVDTPELKEIAEKALEIALATDASVPEHPGAKKPEPIEGKNRLALAKFRAVAPKGAISKVQHGPNESSLSRMTGEEELVQVSA